MLKLFYTPGTCSLASHIALEEAGAGYEVHRVDFSKAEPKRSSGRWLPLDAEILRRRAGPWPSGERQIREFAFIHTGEIRMLERVAHPVGSESSNSLGRGPGALQY